jgi:putative effector of murein hydrolase LrgA (UPF0299 family)
LSRALAAAALAALSVILIFFCSRGLWPVAPMTLAFIGACVAILGSTDEQTTVAWRRTAIAMIVANTIILIIACGLLFHSFAA